MRTKEQIIAEQKSIGNEIITAEEYYRSNVVGEIRVYLKEETLFFRPEQEDKNVFNSGNYEITIYKDGLAIKENHRGIYFTFSLNASLPILLEAIKEAEKQGLWK